MNIVYNGIEILASSVEVFVLYKIYSILYISNEESKTLY